MKTLRFCASAFHFNQQQIKRMKKTIWINLVTIIASLSILIAQAIGFRLQCQYALRQAVNEKREAIEQACGDYLMQQLQLPSDKAFVVSLATEGGKQVTDTYTSIPESFVENGIVKFDKRLALQEDTFYIPVTVPYDLWGTCCTRYFVAERGLLTPKRLETFLRTRLDDPTLQILPSADKCLTVNAEVLSAGSFFRPSYQLLFGINPLKHENVRITGSIGTDTLIGQMYGTLLASAAWAVLLMLCLIYQARTIHGQVRLNRLRNDFLHAMIHELKRPVQSLKILMSVLKDEEMSRDKTLRQEVVRDAQTELDNLSAYFSKLRDMTYGDLKQIPLNLTVFDFNALVRPLIKKTERQGVTVRFQPDKDPMPMRADQIHIRNIFSNLLENAVKYAQGDVTIDIRIHSQPHRIDIEVGDNGRGISADEQKHVFEKFYRSQTVRREGIPGLGLGLSYVKSLVEAHQGEITVKSEAGIGTTFYISLPQ